ncbi:MAG: hypothetical protein KAS63_01765 [Candidatus Heimdallarchaeota archaeon]|nr:hypothetical protein [Candidatus Heimdallarchaeota archaeon]MCK4954061.1 hypothetical protein [Candidatus Heimdallarchaeota archaeon]
MKNTKLDFKLPCYQCSNKTLSRCKGCRRSLCGRCSSKKSIWIPIINHQIPAGLCKDCRELLLIQSSLGLAMDVTTFFSQLPEKIDEWKKKFL